MTLLQSLILGIIQGLTEFLPISSSAHLVLIPHLLGWQIPEAQVFPFGVLVQIGTLVAVILYFWTDLWVIVRGFIKALVDRKPFESEPARMGWYLLLATIPAGIAGILIKDQVEAAFNSPTTTALFLFVTAALLILAEFLGKRTRTLSEIKWLDALWIGIFQALSLFPGISRSGSTITGGMTRNFDRPSAARFSFLMSIPVMIGAGLVSIKDALEVPNFGDFLPILLVGFLSALLVGYLSIHWLLKFLGKRPLYVFAIYCVVFALVVLGFGMVKKDAKADTLPVLQTTQAVSTGNNEQSLVPLIAANPDESPITVTYTSSLSWLVPAMSVCTDSIPGLAIITHEAPSNLMGTFTDQIYFHWGPIESVSSTLYVIGSEQLALITHAENPLASLSPDLVQQIYTAELRTWGELYGICPDCFSSQPDEDFKQQSLELFGYSTQNEPQLLFEANFLDGSNTPNTLVQVVPGSEEMVKEIAVNPHSIGFLASRFLTEDVKRVAIAGDFDLSVLSAPILAITSGDMPESTQAWLECIQAVLKP
jgi:undecaprenyl-diphosphatase